jgi:hypothetical protein
MKSEQDGKPKRQFQFGQLDYLPELVDLPVVRATYCSQEMTDSALRFLWQTEPDLVRALGQQERGGYDATYIMQLTEIVDFFKNVASKSIQIPDTRLGMLDLVFELSRRLRVALGYKPPLPSGTSLKASLDSKLPDIPALPIDISGISSTKVTQEMVDRLISAVINERPDLIYEFSENLRRGGIWPHDIVNEIRHVLRKHAIPEDEIGFWTIKFIGGEINRRLTNFCKIQNIGIKVQ